MDLYASVSKVEQFRKLRTEDFVTEESFIQDIKGEGRFGWQARYGSALHACIEQPERWVSMDRDGYLWTDPYKPDSEPIFWPSEVVDACRSAWPKPCVWEARIPEVTWRVGKHELVTAGRTDALHGNVIVEGKTRFGAVYLENYTESLQWPFYLVATPWATGVQYRVHEIRGIEDEGGKPAISSRGGIRLAEIHAFTMWRQPGLQERLQREVEEFVAWAESRGLLGYLKRYEAKS